MTREGLRALAERAADDPAALEELRRVESVDGMPVDLERALAGADGEQLRQRLRALTETSSGTVDSAAARERASEILAQRRFREPRTPKPLKGLADRFNALGDWIEERLDSFGGWMPGGAFGFWTLLAAMVILLSVVLAQRFATRRRSAAHATGPLLEREDPGALEREAEAAETAGEFERALRLRFRAGLLRLAAKGVLPYRASLTSGEIRRTLRTRTFDRLAATFDRVAYGRAEARADDVEEARTGWRELQREVAR